MTWRETKRVDDVVIYEGPANDSFMLEFGNEDRDADELLGLDYGTWTWAGAIQDADGNQVATVDCIDIREGAEATDDYVLKQQGIAVFTEDLIPDAIYYGGIRGQSSGGFGSTYIEFELHAGRILVP